MNAINMAAVCFDCSTQATSYLFSVIVGSLVVEDPLSRKIWGSDTSSALA